jgi:hypothetical protein
VQGAGGRVMKAAGNKRRPQQSQMWWLCGDSGVVLIPPQFPSVSGLRLPG